MRLWMTCPWSETVSDYDREHLYLFSLLLDGETEGASRETMARIVFGIDPGRQPKRAALVVRSHLRRAHWLMRNGYPWLNW